MIYQDLPSVPSLCAEGRILNTSDISVHWRSHKANLHPVPVVVPAAVAHTSEQNGFSEVKVRVQHYYVPSKWQAFHYCSRWIIQMETLEFLLFLILQFTTSLPLIMMRTAKMHKPQLKKNMKIEVPSKQHLEVTWCILISSREICV